MCHGVVADFVALGNFPMDEVGEIVQRAHVAASDMSRASMLATSPLCLRLRRAAKGIENVLRGEGL